MFTPVQKATPAFMKRYNAIKSGHETLDTAAKLKDFWLFAIEEGWKSREMREYIAKLTFYASPYEELIRFTGASDLFMAYNYFETFQFIGESMESDVSDEEYADRAWQTLEEAVRKIKVPWDGRRPTARD